MTIRSRRALLGSVAAGAVIFAAGRVFARAGGGGGFSGGGDGAGFLIYLLLRLVFECPQLGVPLLIVAAFIFYRTSKGGYSAHVSYTIRRGLAADSAARIEAGLASIRQRDPAFAAAAFLKRCYDRFPGVQEAWSRQDMTPVRHFLSDGVFDRFALQIEMQKGSGIRNEMRGVRVLDARLAGAAADRFFDTLHVAVTAEAVDTTVALEDGRRVQGSGAAESFTEIWTFLRRPGAKTLERPGLLEGCCPNCGARLRLSTSIICGACQALVNSGEYDWVLSEITQQEAWALPSLEQVEGVAELQQRDPGFTAQAVEDRVSALFWHCRAAEFFGSEEYLHAVALPAFIEREREAWRPDEEGRRLLYADAAVGSVDLAGVVLAGEGGGMDRVRVRVQWSGHRELRQVPGVYKPEPGLSRLLRQEYVLARKSGEQSVQAAALTSLHCPGCGAPQVARRDGACRYCGLPQNDGSGAWVLESVEVFSGFIDRAAEPAAAEPFEGVRLSLHEQEALIQCVVAVMLADGVVDPGEDRQLMRMAARHHISAPRMQALIASTGKDDAVRLPQVEGWEKRVAFFRALVQMCLADGNVSRCERQVLRALAVSMGYADVDIDLMINRERAELYAASRAAIKAGRERRS